jgi:hypothetical protein
VGEVEDTVERQSKKVKDGSQSIVSGLTRDLFGEIMEADIDDNESIL